MNWQQANEALRRQVLAVCPPQAHRCVFAYLSLAHEADTASLIDAYRAAGQVLVPVIEAREPMVACLFEGWDRLRPGVLGILRPQIPKTVDAPVSLVLVPGLAFTRRGDRLGYGGGYYDRWLAEHPEALRVGICLDFQILPSLPTEAHDIGMDLVVTNAGAWRTHRRT